MTQRCASCVLPTELAEAAAAAAAAAAEASAPGPRAMLCGRARVMRGPGGPVGRTEWHAVACLCTFQLYAFAILRSRMQRRRAAPARRASEPDPVLCFAGALEWCEALKALQGTLDGVQSVSPLSTSALPKQLPSVACRSSMRRPPRPLARRQRPTPRRALRAHWSGARASTRCRANWVACGCRRLPATTCVCGW